MDNNASQFYGKTSGDAKEEAASGCDSIRRYTLDNVWGGGGPVPEFDHPHGGNYSISYIPRTLDRRQNSCDTIQHEKKLDIQAVGRGRAKQAGSGERGDWM